MRREFPVIRNCCLDVRAAFNRVWDATADGTGFDISVRNRMKAQETWEVVFQTALVITQELRLVIIVRNWGKHRSLSVRPILRHELPYLPHISGFHRVSFFARFARQGINIFTSKCTLLGRIRASTIQEHIFACSSTFFRLPKYHSETASSWPGAASWI